MKHKLSAKQQANSKHPPPLSQLWVCV